MERDNEPSVVRSMINLNGQQLPDGKTVTTDHLVQTFTVEVRSLSGVSPAAIKRLIEQRHEVVNIVEEKHLIYVR